MPGSKAGSVLIEQAGGQQDGRSPAPAQINFLFVHRGISLSPTLTPPTAGKGPYQPVAGRDPPPCQRPAPPSLPAPGKPRSPVHLGLESPVLPSVPTMPTAAQTPAAHRWLEELHIWSGNTERKRGWIPSQMLTLHTAPALQATQTELPSSQSLCKGRRGIGPSHQNPKASGPHPNKDPSSPWTPLQATSCAPKSRPSQLPKAQGTNHLVSQSQVPKGGPRSIPDHHRLSWRQPSRAPLPA